MGWKLRRIGVALVAACAVSGALAAPLPLHRGVGLHEWLNWSPLAEDGTYRWPPYQSIPEWLTRYRPLSDWPEGNEFARIRAFGFDFVRLTVDPGPLLASEGAARTEALGVLEAAVRQVAAAGLGVVVNFHPNTQVDSYGPRAVEGGPDAPAVIAYRDSVVDVARMLAGLGTDRLAIEPFNEPAYHPCDATGSEDWQHVVETQVAAIRAVSRALTIVVTGACGGDVEGLVDIVPRFDDPAILYSFHMYEPHSFTHQRDEYGWYAGFPWPAASGSPEAVIGFISAAMDAAGVDPFTRARVLGQRHYVDAYFAEGWGEAQLAARIGQAVAWAEANAIPPERLFMGEFGVIALSEDGRRGAFDADRFRYIEAARRIAERHGIPWSVWEYSNPFGMSFILPDGPAIADPLLVRALGLPAQ